MSLIKADFTVGLFTAEIRDRLSWLVRIWDRLSIKITKDHRIANRWGSHAPLSG